MKPDAAIDTGALAKLAVAPHEAMFVGDTVRTDVGALGRFTAAGRDQTS